jgi:hypothetical protein
MTGINHGNKSRGERTDTKSQLQITESRIEVTDINNPSPPPSPKQKREVSFFDFVRFVNRWVKFGEGNNDGNDSTGYIYVFIVLSTYLPIYLSFYLSIFRFFNLAIYLSS